MKRIVTLLLTVVIALAVLAGCPKKKAVEPGADEQKQMQEMMKKEMQKMQKEKAGQ